jgi:hypothetical protein
VVHLLVLLLDWHLAIVVHVHLIVLLLLQHQKLLLLFLIKHVNATVFSSSWDTSREVGQLIELVEVLGSLQKDFLVIVKVVVWVDVRVAKQVAVLLKVLNLVVQVYEFLGLLLHQERSFGNVELHESLLLVVNALKISHLVPTPLQRVGPLLAELGLIIADGRRLLHSASQTNLLYCANMFFLLLFHFLLNFLSLSLPAKSNKSLVLLCSRRIHLHF